jgi:endo-1,4-beta-xylanase
MADISRRAWMTGAAALSVGEAFGATMRHEKKHGRGHTHHHNHSPKAGTAPDSLNGVARTKGLWFGSAIGAGLKAPVGMTELKPFEGKRAAGYNDPRMRALQVAQCGILVPENELKWYTLRRQPGAFDFKGADTLVDFATGRGMAMRGHTLLWNRSRWMPPWVNTYDFGTNPATAAEKMLRDHIKTVCTRYGERIFSYDVINETIAPDTGTYEDSPFTKVLGPNVVDICFHAAREFAPHAELVYNDYMGWGAKEGTHRAGVLSLLDYMKKNNLPVDTLGIQSHIGSNGLGTATGPINDADPVEWRKFLDQVTAMGFNLIVTEFDVNDKYVEGDVATRDKAVADYGKAYLEILTSYPQLRYIMAWGIVDKYSWLQRTSPRTDGSPKRPCPYDDDFQPKPLRAAIAETISAAPSRPDMDIKPA